MSAIRGLEDEKIDHERADSVTDGSSGYERKALKVSGTKLGLLAFSTLGIIYSDIGTSPLYVLNGIWSASGDVPPEEDIIGGVSAIIWAITLIPLLKYVVFALEFETGEGEGGPFALFMTLFPKHDIATDEGRSLTTYSTMDPYTERKQANRDRLGKLARFRWPLMIWTIFGTSLTLADGVLTPAVSVVSAVEGIAVAKPAVINDIVGVSIALLVCLFAVQRFGTSRLSFAFAPVTFIWLALLGATGWVLTIALIMSRMLIRILGSSIYNITSHPGIWRACDPSRAIMWFVRTKNYDNLAGVLLAITGCEAMFLGQFNKGSIRIAFCGWVYPMLILNYLGQGARLIEDPTVLGSMFYLTIPGKTGGPLYWIMFVFAVLAAFIASQAMITGTFSLIHQLIGMGAFPAIRIKHTSNLTYGQVYIGAVNWLLMIGAIAVVGGFGSNSAINLAYGFAVATVLFVTTTLIAISIPFVKGYSYVFGIAFLIFFGFLDGIFWGAALKKVPHGAWMPLGLGTILCILMSFWAWGRELEQKFEDSNSEKLSKVIITRQPHPTDRPKTPTSHGIQPVDEAPLTEGDDDDKPLYLTFASHETKLERIPVIAVFHRNDSAGRGVPHSFTSFLRKYPALPRVVIFLSTRVVGVPHVPLQDRYIVNKVRSLSGFFSVTMRIGYLDRSPPSVPDLLPFIQHLDSTSGLTPTKASAHRDLLESAGHNPTHIIPNYTIYSKGTKAVSGWVRRFLVEEIYGRARVVFPDRHDAPAAVDDITLHVGVPAYI